MKENRFKLLILSSITLLSVAAASTGIFTYASFDALGQVTQQVKYSGTLKKSIYLNANVWNVDNPAYYLYDDINNVWIAPTKYIEQEVYHSDGVGHSKLELYVFELNVSDTTSTSAPCTSFNFVRINPNYDGTVPSWDAKWNQTNDITENANYNYYVINGWAETSYKKNNIYINGAGNMQFSGSDV